MLPDLQRALCRGLLEQAEQTEILARIRPAAHLSAAQQLAVYRNSLTAGMARALADTYPVCRRLVGQDFFHALCRAYITLHTSRSPDLNDYGADFGDFLRDFDGVQSLPYLPDVARLEWLWQRAFTARNTRPLSHASLARVSEARRERLQVGRVPASGLLASPYPAHRIWTVNQDDYAGDTAVDLAEGGVRLLVWRKGVDMRMQALSPAEWALLKAIDTSQTLAEVCRQLAEHFPQTDLARLLSGAITQCWLTTSHRRARISSIFPSPHGAQPP